MFLHHGLPHVSNTKTRSAGSKRPHFGQRIAKSFSKAGRGAGAIRRGRDATVISDYLFGGFKHVFFHNIYMGQSFPLTNIFQDG
jgi:hypothetical protein